MTMLNACPEAHAFATLMLWKGGILGVLNGFYIFFDLSSLFFFKLATAQPQLVRLSEPLFCAQNGRRDLERVRHLFI